MDSTIDSHAKGQFMRELGTGAPVGVETWLRGNVGKPS